MNNFCGACGTRNDDNAVRCSKCGAFFTSNMNPPIAGGGTPSGNAAVGGYGYNNGAVTYQYIQENDKGKGAAGKIVKIVIALLLAVVVLLGGLLVYRYTGYRAALNRFKNYFGDYNYSKIVDNYSIAVFDNANPENNYAELDEQTKEKLDVIYDYFDEELESSKYKLTFKTVDDHRMTDDEYDDFMNAMEYDLKDDVMYDARIAEFKITASEGNRKASKNVELILTLEDGADWKIYSFDEI